MYIKSLYLSLKFLLKITKIVENANNNKIFRIFNNNCYY